MDAEKKRMTALEQDEEQKLLRRMRLEQLAREGRLMQVEHADRTTALLLEKSHLLREMELQRLDKE